MRVFVCEFVTGGGLRDAALPESLAREAALIRDAMRRDLAALPQVNEILLAADDRLPVPGAVAVTAGADAWAIWRTLAQQADVVWPVAPETDGVLARLVEMLREHCVRVLACDPEAIAVATSKLETARRLAAAGVPHISTFPLAQAPDLPGPRITKPDDGAGCEDTLFWPEEVPATPARRDGLVIQPFVAGEAASLTVLAGPEGLRLLTVNRQHIAVEDGRVFLAGLTVGALGDGDGRLAALAGEVVRAMPGLEGIFGIDILLTDAGPVVVEVNPRLTTAYAGLGAALGLNPATLLPPFADAGATPRTSNRTPVELALA
ncbi:ATP-grasp domain-containing protein [Xanthobacter oligotrophicus]|uniref:ATP-grasp domain-containing protein n=1 Tax=Xanthobacter oligotrophicus TaxID=2607286 RepID=UPI0011F1DFA3|nr:ATP-grasp domain-containing protein [Xanthobacter oligotrophicus]MCG5237702.1 ATP-grasp domain-containing protein [Xanthobacter oligotrophicus]